MEVFFVNLRLHIVLSLVLMIAAAPAFAQNAELDPDKTFTDLLEDNTPVEDAPRIDLTPTELAEAAVRSAVPSTLPDVQLPVNEEGNLAINEGQVEEARQALEERADRTSPDQVVGQALRDLGSLFSGEEGSRDERGN